MALFKKILILTIISSITINLSYAQHWSRGWAPAGKKKRSAANIDYSQQFPGKIIDSENENLDDQHTGLTSSQHPNIGEYQKFLLNTILERLESEQNIYDLVRQKRLYGIDFDNFGMSDLLDRMRFKRKFFKNKKSGSKNMADRYIVDDDEYPEPKISDLGLSNIYLQNLKSEIKRSSLPMNSVNDSLKNNSKLLNNVKNLYSLHKDFQKKFGKNKSLPDVNTLNAYVQLYKKSNINSDMHPDEYVKMISEIVRSLRNANPWE